MIYSTSLIAIYIKLLRCRQFYCEVMSWQGAIESTQLGLPVSVPGLSHFRGVCKERGRDVEFEIQGYLELITFKDAWKWRAKVVDVATGIEASAAGFLSKDTAMREAMKNLFDKLEHHGAVNKMKLPYLLHT